MNRNWMHISTAREAALYRYGMTRRGSARRRYPANERYKPHQCGAEGWGDYQCMNKPGYGPGNLFCKFHAGRLKRETP